MLPPRDGDTSLAGQCCNEGVVIDWAKYCHRLLELDTDGKRAVVETGIVLDDLNAQLCPYGLMVGPHPSTHPACTIGGVIGNNACGSTAQRGGGRRGRRGRRCGSSAAVAEPWSVSGERATAREGKHPETAASEGA